MLIQKDPWLEPYAEAIEGRHNDVIKKEQDLTQNGRLSLSDFASGYLYFGLQRMADGRVGVPGMGSKCHRDIPRGRL